MEIGERVVTIESLHEDDDKEAEVPVNTAGMVIGHVGREIVVVSMDIESFVGGPVYVTASDRYFRRAGRHQS